MLLARGGTLFTVSRKKALPKRGNCLRKPSRWTRKYAAAYASLGWTYWLEWGLRWSADPQTLEHALVLAQQALALDDSLPGAHSLLSVVYRQKQQYEQAIAEGERAIALDPNNADSYVMAGGGAELRGQARRSPADGGAGDAPQPSLSALVLIQIGLAYRMTGRYAEAIAALKEAISRNPNICCPPSAGFQLRAAVGLSTEPGLPRR